MHVSHSWIALIDGKVLWDTDEYATAFLHSNWLFFLWHDVREDLPLLTLLQDPLIQGPSGRFVNSCPSIILYVVWRELGFIPCFMMWQRIWLSVRRVIVLLNNYFDKLCLSNYVYHRYMYQLTFSRCSRANTHVDSNDRMICRMDGRKDDARFPILFRICDTIPRNPCCFFRGTTLERSVAVVTIRPGSSVIQTFVNSL